MRKPSPSGVAVVLRSVTAGPSGSVMPTEMTSPVRRRLREFLLLNIRAVFQGLGSDQNFPPGQHPRCAGRRGNGLDGDDGVHEAPALPAGSFRKRDAEQPLLRHELRHVPWVIGLVRALARPDRGACSKRRAPPRGTAAAPASAGSPCGRMVAERDGRPVGSRRRLGSSSTGLRYRMRPSRRPSRRGAGQAPPRAGRRGYPRNSRSCRDRRSTPTRASATRTSPASALARAALERDAHPESHEVSAHVVDRRDRQQARLAFLPCASAMPLTACTMLSKPRRSRHGPVGPQALREAHTMPGRSPARRFGREPFRRERAWTVRLDEHVGLSNQLLQGFPARSQINARRTLAYASVEIHQPGIGQVRHGDLQNVGAVLGEAFRARRPGGEHAGEIKSPHAAGGRLDRFSFSIGESEMRSMVMSG